MAITIEQDIGSRFNTGAGGNNQMVLLSRAKLICVFSSNNTAQTNFKYLVQLEEDGVQIFESYVTPNPAGVCMFDFSPIVKDRLTTPVKSSVDSNSIQSGMFDIDPVTKCDGGQNLYTIKIGEVYEVSGVLTEFPNLANEEYLIINGWQDYKDYYYVSGTHSLELIEYSCNYLAPVEIQKGFLTKVGVETYAGTKNNEYFRQLAGASIAVPTRETDLGCVAWIHDNVHVSNDTTSIKYEWYNASGVSLGSYTVDVTDPANGGQTLSSTDPEGKVLAAPCHWGSMSNNGSLVGAFTNAFAWTYYTIQLVQADATAANYKWCFYEDCSGNKNELYQLAWSNGVGFWDYYTFKPMTMHEQSAEKKQYNTNAGTYSASTFQLEQFTAGTKNYQVTPTRSWTLSSGKIDENLSMYLKDIIKAREVQLIDPQGNILPVIVDTNSTQFYKDRTNKLYDFQIKVKLAQRLEA